MESIFLKLKEELGEKLKKDEVLAPYTTFKIGGPAKYFYEANSERDIILAIRMAKKLNIPYYILGGGSNILISDGGFNGLIIKIGNNEIAIKGNRIKCGAGVSLARLVKYSADNGLSGLEWAIGVPGTVGGAVRGNAGCFGGQMSDIVHSAKVFQNKKSFFLNNKELKFSYRETILKQQKIIILSVELKFKIMPKNLVKQKIKDILKRRRNKILFNNPSAGSVFKKPIVSSDIFEIFKDDTAIQENYYGSDKNNKIPAGYLIDRLDLKEKTIGGAIVSKDDANFILNINNATAENVIMLISIIKQKVRSNYSIQLEEEIELVGF